jgi:hypothetical protein
MATAVNKRLTVDCWPTACTSQYDTSILWYWQGQRMLLGVDLWACCVMRQNNRVDLTGRGPDSRVPVRILSLRIVLTAYTVVMIMPSGICDSVILEIGSDVSEGFAAWSSRQKSLTSERSRYPVGALPIRQLNSVAGLLCSGIWDSYCGANADSFPEFVTARSFVEMWEWKHSSKYHATDILVAIPDLLILALEWQFWELCFMFRMDIRRTGYFFYCL